jgi:hypothetical protein
MALAKTKSVSLGSPIHIYEGTYDLSAIPYGTTAMAEQDVTVTGILATDIVVSFYCTDACTFGIGNCRVKADNTISIVPVSTDTDTAVNPSGSLNYRLIVISGD